MTWGVYLVKNICQTTYLCYDERMTIRKFWADSRGKVAVVLALVWLTSLIHQLRASAVAFPLLAIASCYAVDALLSRLQSGTWFFSLSSLVTGLLIGLIVDPTSVAMLFTAVVFASLSKHFLGFDRQKHIFNPAALGIVLSSVLLNRPVAWWGATWGMIPVFIIFFGMIVPLRQLRRLWMPISFLLVYGTALMIVSGVESALRLTFDPTVFLFAWVMLTEPMTSPNRGFWRYGWGVLVAILVIGQQIFSVSWLDPLLTALLLANGVGFFLTRIV